MPRFGFHSALPARFRRGYLVLGGREYFSRELVAVAEGGLLSRRGAAV